MVRSFSTSAGPIITGLQEHRSGVGLHKGIPVTAIHFHCVPARSPKPGSNGPTNVHSVMLGQCCHDLVPWWTVVPEGMLMLGLRDERRRRRRSPGPPQAGRTGSITTRRCAGPAPGSLLDSTFFSAPPRARGGAIVGGCVIARDIAEHKRAQQEITRLYEQQRHVALTLQRCPDGVSAHGSRHGYGQPLPAGHRGGAGSAATGST